VPKPTGQGSLTLTN